MIPKEVYDYDKQQLIDWLRNEAGSSNPDYFHAKATGGLKLQQVPEEFAELLLLLKSKNVQDYLELGIGNGGSFETICYFLKDSLSFAMAVDNLAYGALINQTETEIRLRINRINASYLPNERTYFTNESTDEFFKSLDPEESKFDAIFIDADHSYLGALKDYNGALNHIKKGGLIIFHDINSAACPGIMRLWREVKSEHSKYYEFIASNTCGIGVVEI